MLGIKMYLGTLCKYIKTELSFDNGTTFRNKSNEKSEVDGSHKKTKKYTDNAPAEGLNLVTIKPLAVIESIDRDLNETIEDEEDLPLSVRKTKKSKAKKHLKTQSETKTATEDHIMRKKEDKISNKELEEFITIKSELRNAKEELTMTQKRLATAKAELKMTYTQLKCTKDKLIQTKQDLKNTKKVLEASSDQNINEANIR